MAAIGAWVWELVAAARDASEKAGQIAREAFLEVTRLVEHDEELMICQVTSGAYAAIEITDDEPTWIVHGFLFGCVSIGLAISNEHFIGICGKGGFLMENHRKGSSSQRELASIFQETEVTSLGAWISLDFDFCGVPCGSLDACFHLAYGGCWDVADDVREAGGAMYDSGVALLCYPFAYCP